ncbi:uncharacterized protein LOC116339750 [Contarinia nasturtii]|uniref:uncharacterized protein LOC116339750 n=1 Tax=Contarinia nasturtii TaxID=265458 RepID=UPI0012D41E80|nr:uncharacterized protein LOC116339750 [Contarinia nasturtii]
MKFQEKSTIEQESTMELSVDQKTDKLKIVLDHANNTYHSSHTIHGTIFFPENYTEIRGVFFHFIGTSRVGWTELLIRESKPVEGKKETSDSRYYGREEHLAPVKYIIGSKGGGFFTPERSYRFSFELKTDLPSTFASDCGEIKYKMKFVVDKRWFNEKQKIPLHIIRSVNLNFIPDTLQPFELQLTKNYGYLTSSGPISLHVSIPKRGFVLGDKILIKATVCNSSKINVEKVKYYLNQIIEYHSTAPSERIKTENKRLLKKEIDGICKQSEMENDLVIDVPENLPPTQDKSISRLILIKYEVKVEAKIGGIHKSLVITTPITIGTIPHTINSRPLTICNAPNLPNETPFILGAMGTQVDVGSIFPNLSQEMNLSQNQNLQLSDRSSIQLRMYPSPIIGFLPNESMESQLNRLSLLSHNSFANIPYQQPTAPPPDFNAGSPIRPVSQFIVNSPDRPPSYQQACFPTQMNYATSSPLQETSNKI